MEPEIHVFCIGADGTEYFAAASEEDMREWYARSGYDTEGLNLSEYFREVADLDAEFDFNDDGEERRTTWRKLAEECRTHWPCQISSGYN